MIIAVIGKGKPMRLINADEIYYDRLLKTGNKENPLEQAVSHLRIDSMPTIDAIPVVRCKDCVYSSGFAALACPMVGQVNLKDDDFCCRGDKRDDEN